MNVKARHDIREPFIDTSYSIRHRLELKIFRFAQFLLNAIEQVINLEKVRTENLKSRTDLQD